MNSKHCHPSFLKPLSLLPLGLLMMSLGACANQIDDEKVEKAISDGLKEKVDLSVDSVTCPEDQAIEEGNEFTCEVSIKDQTFDAKVVQEDDEGTIRWDAQEGLETLKGLIPNEVLEQKITDGIAEQLNIEVTTDCGPKYVIVSKGETYECTATDAQNNGRPVRVEATDDNGNVRWSLQE